MLYLGWSHDDPHFNLVHGQLLTRLDGFARRGYAAMFDPVPDAARAELERRNIEIVLFPGDGDRTRLLADWLHSLQ